MTRYRPGWALLVCAAACRPTAFFGSSTLTHSADADQTEGGDTHLLPVADMGADPGDSLADCTSADGDPHPVTVIQYAGTDDLLQNPERGIYHQMGFADDRVGVPLTDSEIADMRGHDFSMIQLEYFFRNARTRDYTVDELQLIEDNFTIARREGFKVILRFGYSETDGFDGTVPSDASLDQIRAHIGQLGPLWQANEDVIAFMNLGFIGAWGELHTSSSGLANTAGWSAVLDEVLDKLPVSRMTQLRTTYQIFWVFGLPADGSGYLTEAMAYGGTAQARTGIINDCYLHNADDSGTYSCLTTSDGGGSTDNCIWDSSNIEVSKTFLSFNNRYVVQSGEVCGWLSPYSDCANALQDFARLRWSAISQFDEWPNSGEFETGWSDQGCLDEIKRKLGYRFRLVDGAYSAAVSRGGNFIYRITLANDGWAAPYNPRSIELLFRDRASGATARVPVPGAPQNDLRYWLGGETHILEGSLPLPSTMEAGDYDVLLALADPAPTLRDRAEYAIRLANADTWEPAAGANNLLTVLHVD